MIIRLKKHKIITYMLMFLLYVGIAIDNIVGFQMRTTSGESSLSKIYRLLIFVVVLFIVYRYNKKNGLFFLLLGYGFLIPVIQIIINGNGVGFFVDELYIAKLLFPITLIVAGIALSEHNCIELNDIDTYISSVSWIYPLSIILPFLFDAGFKAYGSSGYSGYYSSGNELSILLGVTFVIHMNNLYKKISLKTLIGVFLSAVTVILTGTKAGTIIIVLTVIYYVYLLLKENKRLAKKIFYSVSGVIILVFFMLMIINLLGNEISANLERLKYKYAQLDNNLVNFMFSYRNMKIEPNFETALQNPISLIWGKGYYNQVLVHGTSKITSAGLIEMDFFDILFQYGAIMAIVVWGIYLSCIIRCRKNYRNQYSFAIIMMLLYSFMAGHTLYSAQTGTMLAVLAIGIVLAKKEMV